MGELTGGLIRMNVHMVVTADAKRAMIFGGVMLAIFTALLVYVILDTKSNNRIHKIGVCILFMALSIGALIIGANMPRAKEVRVCADGPISLEQVATVYDIKNIDGKELVLWER